MDVRRPALLSLLLLGASAIAAPFVAGDPQPLATRIADSRAAVIVVRDDAAKGAPSWQIADVLRDSVGTVATGQRVHPRPAPPPDAAQALLISNPDRSVEIVPLSEAAAAYLKAAPASTASAPVRFRFVTKHLAARDPVVADDVSAELSRFNAADFARWSNQLPREALRRAVEDSATPAHRVGFYACLLGFCGSLDDAECLRRRLLSAEGIADGADGLAAGYLLLSGEEGLRDLETQILMNGEASPLLAAAVLDAIAFLRTESIGPFEAPRLRQAVCCGLCREGTADLAASHLAAVRDWEAIDEVAALLERPAERSDRARSGQVAAARYLLECRRDADASSDVRNAADRHLRHIAISDADLIRRATRLSGEPRQRH